MDQLLPKYGIWVDESEEAADARAVSGAAPDVVFFPGQHVSGSDAIEAAAQRWPGKHVVRIVEQIWTAV